MIDDDNLTIKVIASRPRANTLGLWATMPRSSSRSTAPTAGATRGVLLRITIVNNVTIRGLAIYGVPGQGGVEAAIAIRWQFDRYCNRGDLPRAECGEAPPRTRIRPANAATYGVSSTEVRVTLWVGPAVD